MFRPEAWAEKALIRVLSGSKARDHSRVEDLFAMTPRIAKREGVTRSVLIAALWRVLKTLHKEGRIHVEWESATDFGNAALWVKGLDPKFSSRVEKLGMSKTWAPIHGRFSRILNWWGFHTPLRFCPLQPGCTSLFQQEIEKASLPLSAVLHLWDWQHSHEGPYYLGLTRLDARARFVQADWLFGVYNSPTMRSLLQCPSKPLTEEGRKYVAFQYAVLTGRYWPSSSISEVLHQGFLGLEHDDLIHPVTWEDVLAERIRSAWQQGLQEAWDIPIGLDIKSAGLSLWSVMAGDVQLAEQVGTLEGVCPTRAYAYKPWTDVNLRRDQKAVEAWLASDPSELKDDTMTVFYGKSQSSVSAVVRSAYSKGGVFERPGLYLEACKSLKLSPFFTAKGINGPIRNGERHSFQPKVHGSEYYSWTEPVTLTTKFSGLDITLDVLLEDHWVRELSTLFWPCAPLHSGDMFLARNAIMRASRKGYWFFPVYDEYWCHPSDAPDMVHGLHHSMQILNNPVWLRNFCMSLGMDLDLIQTFAPGERFNVSKYFLK